MTHQLYRHFDVDRRLLYVGISNSAAGRLDDHRYGSRWHDLIVRIEIERFTSKKDAIAAEIRAIKEENPIYNIRRGALTESSRPLVITDPERLDLLERGEKAGIKLRKRSCIAALKHAVEAAERGDLAAARCSMAFLKTNNSQHNAK